MTEQVGAIEPINAAIFRRVLGHYPTGVCIITATEDDTTPVALVVGSFTSVSLDPPLVAFLPHRKSASWARIQQSGHFCVNVLGSHQHDLCQRFSDKDGSRYTDLSYRLSKAGSPIFNGIIAWVDCAIEAVYEAGDHFIVMGRVRELAIERPDRPLLFFRGGYGTFSPLPPP